MFLRKDISGNWSHKLNYRCKTVLNLYELNVLSFEGPPHPKSEITQNDIWIVDAYDKRGNPVNESLLPITSNRF